MNDSYGDGFAAGKEKAHFELRYHNWESHNADGKPCWCENCITYRTIALRTRTDFMDNLGADGLIAMVKLSMDRIGSDDNQDLIDKLRDLIENGEDDC